MNTELVTVWSGAHAGRDADLLLTAGIPEKRYGLPGENGSLEVAHRQRGGRKPGRVAAIAACRSAIAACLGSRRAATKDQLSAVTGFSAFDVEQSLRTMVRRGLVHSLPLPQGSGLRYKRVTFVWGPR